MRFEREFIQTDRTEEHVIVVTEDERAHFIGQFRIVGEHPEESMAVEKQPHGENQALLATDTKRVGIHPIE